MPPTDLFNNWVKGFLAVSTTLGFFGTIAGLMYLGKLPTEVKDILLVMLGALIANYKELSGYFFGSSSGAAKANEAVAAAAKRSTDVPRTVKVDDTIPVRTQETPDGPK